MGSQGMPGTSGERPDGPVVRNELAGAAGGVVQAGTVSGGVHYHLPTHGVPVPRQLASAPVAFVGRVAELRRLTSALESGSGAVVLSAVAGAGGIGKTWLALRWAHAHRERFPDGQLFVDLQGSRPRRRPWSPPSRYGDSSTRSASIRAHSADPHARAALYRSLVAGKRMLIVLDNAADAAQVEPLLPGSPGCTVLVTSRRRLTGLIARHGACPSGSTGSPTPRPVSC
ncbi:hypothetical protein NKH77_07920 [Streptomyces sp. M19]